MNVKKLVLVSYDVDFKKGKDGAYGRAYDVLESFGMKHYRTNNLREIALPTTTVVGEVEMGPAATPETIRNQLFREFLEADVHITHIIVAFVEDFAGIGEPLALA